MECWSSRASTDEEIVVEQVLMKTHNRSELVSQTSSSSSSSPSASFSNNKDPSSSSSSSSSSSAMQKKLQKLGRNVVGTITNFKNSLNLDSVRDPSTAKIESYRKLVWGGVVRNLTQLYPGSQLPEKLVSNIRKHFDSLPLSYAEAKFDMKEVFLHIRLIEQAGVEDHPAILIQEVSEDETQGSVFKLTFACNSSVSWPGMSEALENASICCKKIQIFEKRGLTLGIVLVLVRSEQERFFKSKFENALISALKKSKTTSMKLSFGLCGCQEDNTNGKDLGEIEEEFEDDTNGRYHQNGVESSNNKVQLKIPLPISSFKVSVDEWQTVRLGGVDIGRWLLSSDQIEFTDQIGPNSFKGVFKGKRVAIERLKGCERGHAYDFEIRRDMLEIMTCGHKNILQFHGVCIEDTHGLCIVTKLMEGGSVQELIQKKKKLQTKEIIRIVTDIAEGIMFLNDHGIPYRDLNTQRILLDRQGSACVGDMGIVTVCKNNGEVTDYETDGYRWLAPEIIAGDPETVTETWMSNVYSFGMVVWEMVTGEAAYASCSPVQAAVGIAACGLRPDIPNHCPQVLRSVMTKCWNGTPSKRPNFAEILRILLRSSENNNR
ncbi:hypothetical protein AQUCO_00400419v1 [Aquilegia coerulea]|uniref:Protein kinase domain-containing protein n=1 Tax=Aquilegia coerulea TaxID=218851 RepID=A0A2G5EV29_AQUCA|nr:hypothetical protein AQUCO_00400419v1 [Aquilegia coerulea]